MNLKSHIYQGIILSPAVYYFSNFRTAIIFLLSFIFIDLDHYFLYTYRHRKFGIKGMFEYFDDEWENHRQNIYELCIFHTIEVFLVLFVLGYWHRDFWVILAGFLIHQAFDMYYLFKHNVLFIKAFSVIEYFIKKEK